MSDYRIVLEQLMHLLRHGHATRAEAGREALDRIQARIAELEQRPAVTREDVAWLCLWFDTHPDTYYQVRQRVNRIRAALNTDN